MRWNPADMSGSVLIVAHPGHELRTFAWYERARPTLFILTDGAGRRSGHSARLDFSRGLAERLGASIGSLFGTFGDQEIYAAIRGRSCDPFLDWASALARELAALDPEIVVVDSWQMYNVAHDLVNAITRAAARSAARRLARQIRIVEYDPAPRSLGAPLPRGQQAFKIELDETALQRKVNAGTGCAELLHEIRTVLTTEGLEAQRVEVYRHLPAPALLIPPEGVVPPYEVFGAERVAAGHYRECIRWKEHVQPIVAALRHRFP